MMRTYLLATAAMLGMAVATPASASLSVLNTFTGQFDVSTDGCGSTSQACTLTANAPVGAVVQAAFLYTSSFSGAPSTFGGTFNGNAVSYTNLGSAGGREAGRMDVTSIVAPVINGGAGGAYNFRYTESAAGQDGGALVVVYSAASAATTTIAILDGFSQTTGDSTSLSFANPLNPLASGFRAEMRLGIGFSFNGNNPQAPTGANQISQITVNGNQLTNVAGHCDDAVDSSCNNGNLITVGDDADPFSTVLPTVAGDHEKYDIKTLLNVGDTQINIRTVNPSNDDNIFLAVFAVSGEAVVTNNDVPEPMSLALLGTGMLGLAIARRRRRG